MKSTIFVKHLNKTGIYVSELDSDKAFIDKDNPVGNFKTVVQPVGNCEIRFAKVKGGYVVDGEGYIICGKNETIIDSEVADFKKDRFPNLVYTEDPRIAEYLNLKAVKTENLSR